MRLVIGSDHGGYELKESLKENLEKAGYEFDDIGTFGQEAVDYPQIGRELAQAVADGRYDRGIILCGTGIGVSIVANKVSGVRASLCHDTFSARAAREHNDANVLAMGGRVIGPGLAADIALVWLQTEFSGDERHIRRISMLEPDSSIA
ncbi:MAG: ribose 5-phosphate isomerase B [bacterium]|jgi:ribose 5-phosphate isomerase B|nr:ribose 5-phosphate isomerase B [bacterium]MDD3805126.1 ribose 5-phosphate isomerase B [bacterium]MDD4558248.1 ribose 5-phosphate isomerase B [bacterium]